MNLNRFNWRIGRERVRAREIFSMSNIGIDGSTWMFRVCRGDLQTLLPEKCLFNYSSLKPIKCQFTYRIDQTLNAIQWPNCSCGLKRIWKYIIIIIIMMKLINSLLLHCMLAFHSISTQNFMIFYNYNKNNNNRKIILSNFEPINAN